MTLKTIKLLLVGLVMTLLSISQALAQDTGETEDFSSTDLQGWELESSAGVVDGALQVPSGSFAIKAGDYSDFTLQVKVKWQGPGELIIQYHLKETTRHTVIVTPGEILLERADSTGAELIGSGTHDGFSGDNWTDLKIAVSGNDHTIWVGGTQVLNVVDSAQLEAGAIGFMVAGETAAQFDDLTLSGTEVAAGEPVPGEPATEEGAPNPGEGEEPAPGVGELGTELDPAGTTVTTLATDKGGVGGWLDNFFSGEAQAAEIGTFAANLVIAALLSFVLGLVYIHWGTSLSNRRMFAANFMLITITTTFIILVVRSSVALSLGLVGALSIVRFRAAIKEPEELAYLFLSVGIGIGLGDNQRLITIIAVAIAIAFIALRRLFHSRDSDVNMHLTLGGDFADNLALPSVLAALRPHTQRLKLVRFDESHGVFEASLLVEFRELIHLHDAHAALLALSPDLDITFLDNQGIG